MGMMPLSISRETRLTRSTRVCMILNLGMTMAPRMPTQVRSSATARMMIQPIPVAVWSTMTMPPKARMGE